jgi:hypothetical protein
MSVYFAGWYLCNPSVDELMLHHEARALVVQLQC